MQLAARRHTLWVISRGRALSIATGYGLDGRKVWNSNPGRGKLSLLSLSWRPALGPTQPPIQQVQLALSSNVKYPEGETDHLSSTTAFVKNTWIYASTPPYVFMA
jgi:hypothetical protein